MTGTTATGIGSMPGEDFAGALRIARDELPDLLPIPEVPARGEHASMTGRTVALLDGIAADLQPTGWRLTDAPGVDARRAISLLAEDLDRLEEGWGEYAGAPKVQLAGPLTLAATIERPRGGLAVADHGARRDLAQSLASGLAEHVGDVRRRTGAPEVVVQVDEPALRAVLDGGVPTASGFGRHRSVHAPEADALLRTVIEPLQDVRTVLHSCAADVPVGLVAGAGFDAVSFDLGLVRREQLPAYGEAADRGVALWPGVIPALEPPNAPDPERVAERAYGFLAEVGASTDDAVLTPACGLAGASPRWARKALRIVREAAGNVPAGR